MKRKLFFTESNMYESISSSSITLQANNVIIQSNGFTLQANDVTIKVNDTNHFENSQKDVDKWYVVQSPIEGRYKGEWKNGLPNGKGMFDMFFPFDGSHSIFEGNFVDGYIHGFGKQIYDITNDYEKFAPYYEGEFKSGDQYGNGTYYYGDGCYRRGNLVNGKFEDNGIYYNSYTNKTWVGNYVNDERPLDNGVWYDGELTMEEAFKDKMNVQIKMEK